MFNNFMLTLALFVAFEGYESSCSFSFVAMNTSHGPNFPTMATWFSGQILKTLNLDFMFPFFKDCCKAFCTHAFILVLFGSR